MNFKKIAKLSNIIAFIVCMALLYWAVIFSTIKLAGLKIFDVYILETINGCAILLSIILLGVFIIRNIMRNLLIIGKSASGNGSNITKKSGKMRIIQFTASFPIIISLLFLGTCISCKRATAQDSTAVEQNIIFEIKDGILDRYPGNAANIRIPEGVTAIGDYAFSGRDKLVSIIIPESVTSIGDYAFAGCYGLTSINFPAGLIHIGPSAFSWCYNLASVIIPESVTSIGDGAFRSCLHLKAIQVDAGNRVYADRNGILFNKNFTSLIQYPAGKAISRYEIPDSVTSIENFAFAGCNHLRSVKMPDGITAIGDYAFSDCGFTFINLPARLTSIGEAAFLSCNNLKSIIIPPGVTSIKKRTFSICDSLASIDLPAGLISIEGSAFFFCTSLASVNLPASLANIGPGAFSGCISLHSINLQPMTPPVLEGELWSLWEARTTIYVPLAAVKDYKNAAGWKNYGEWIQPVWN
jgi:hypothetical protein